MITSRSPFSAKFIFILFLVFGKITLAKDLQVTAQAAQSKFEDVSPEIKIRIGSNPWIVEIQAEEKLAKNLAFTMSPVLPEKYFRTHGIKEERHNCVTTGDDGEGTPDIKNNPKAATTKAKYEPKYYDKATKTLTLNLPAPFVIEAVTKTFDYELVNGKTKYAGKINLESQLNLNPVLAEMLKQYQKESSAVIRSTFPPFVKKVDTDNCNDTSISDNDFSKCDDSLYNCELGRLGEYRMIGVRGWVFAAKSMTGLFPYESVRIDSMTYLGDHYSIDLNGKGHVKNGQLTAKISLGEFSGCFGAGCGESTNVREAFVSIDRNGVMSTALKKRSQSEK